MIELANLIQSIGYWVLEFILYPVLIWTVIAAPISLLLHHIDSIPPIYKYHSSVALLLALPLGVAGTYFFDLITSVTQSTAVPTFFVIKNPISVTAYNSGASAVSLTNPMLWMGILTIMAATGTLFFLLKMLIHFNQLKNFEENLEFKPLSQYNQLVRNLPEISSHIDQIFVAYSNDADIPYTYGWQKMKIVIPADLSDDKEALAMVVQHELMHIKHRDFLLNGILLFIKSLFWFHPLTHSLYTRGREYREITCDSEVLANKQFSKKRYASLLVDLAQKEYQSKLAMSMAVNPSSLKKRIQIMSTQENISTNFRPSFIVALTSMTLIVFGISCTDVAQSNKENSSVTQQVSKADNNNYYNHVETLPKLVGGLASLQKKIQYPEEAREAGIEGRVIVQFIINKDGKVENPQIIKGVHESLEQETLRVVKKAEFEPGMHNGIPVRVQYSLPITYKLPSEKKGMSISKHG